MSKRLLYLAYGELMSTATMSRHVPRAKPVGRARLPGWTLMLHHMGADGSAKASLMRDADRQAWGVLYRLSAASRKVLDAALPGYARTEIEAIDDDDAVQRCVTHCSRVVDDSWVPFEAYRDELVAGALEHHLPDEYVAELQAIATKPGRLPGCGSC